MNKKSAPRFCLTISWVYYIVLWWLPLTSPQAAITSQLQRLRASYISIYIYTHTHNYTYIIIKILANVLYTYIYIYNIYRYNYNINYNNYYYLYLCSLFPLVMSRHTRMNLSARQLNADNLPSYYSIKSNGPRWVWS